jgi:tRNA pseudouridine55 synthase
VSAEGLVVVDKPRGWTSHDVVARLRRLAGTRKVGHAGTLDPMATGVLIVGVGRATRLLGHLAAHDKDYLATIRLGVTTTTDDADGEVVTRTDAVAVTDAAVVTAMHRLTGDIAQVPAAVSAVKVDGQRAYKRVRAGEEVELAARTVRIDAFDLLARRGDELDVAVTCSTGTYVRALARDLGQTLGVGAHLTALRRTRVGAFDLTAARTVEQLSDRLELIPLAAAVAGAFPRLDVDGVRARQLVLGQPVPAAGIGADVRGVFGPDGELIALAQDRGDRLRTLVVFPPSPERDIS